MTTLSEIRRFAVARSLFPPTTLERAIPKIGFVQADPIRAPARAQDLTLRHRVAGYRAGDLERRYAELDVAEDVFVNYGFLPASVQALMHPRARTSVLRAVRTKHAREVLAFVRERGEVHPRQVDEAFSRGTVTNYWGGSSNATTHLLTHMHYSGLVRVVRRDRGVRVYGPQIGVDAKIDAAERRARVDALVDVLVRTYAPLTSAGLSMLVSRLRYGVPQWKGELKPAFKRATARLARARVDGVEWYWPDGERLGSAPADAVRLLGPFDPVVWDRPRFERLWGWRYRFEAYTPAAKRQFGYYALPLLWRDQIIGWANLTTSGRRMDANIGFVSAKRPRDRAFTPELDAELDRMRAFLDAND